MSPYMYLEYTGSKKKDVSASLFVVKPTWKADPEQTYSKPIADSGQIKNFSKADPEQTQSRPEVV